MPKHRLVAMDFMTLDGIIQAPSYPDEDPRGSFTGGWNNAYLSPDAQQWVLSTIQTAAGFLLGHRTYDTFADHWPSAPAEEQAWAEPLNSKPKFVASRTLRDPAWGPVEVLGEPADQIPGILESLSGPLVMIGSGALARSLLPMGLVDTVRLVIDPILIGRGARLFDIDLPAPLRFELHDLVGAESGALLVEYHAV